MTHIKDTTVVSTEWAEIRPLAGNLLALTPCRCGGKPGLFIEQDGTVGLPTILHRDGCAR